MAYITLIEKGNSDSPNIGTVEVNQNLVHSITDAIESHFDARILGGVLEKEVLKCINSRPVTLSFSIEVDGDEDTHEVEFSQTWLYQ